MKYVLLLAVLVLTGCGPMVAEPCWLYTNSGDRLKGFKWTRKYLDIANMPCNACGWASSPEALSACAGTYP